MNDMPYIDEEQFHNDPNCHCRFCSMFFGYLISREVIGVIELKPIPKLNVLENFGIRGREKSVSISDNEELSPFIVDLKPPVEPVIESLDRGFATRASIFSHRLKKLMRRRSAEEHLHLAPRRPAPRN